MAKVKAKAIEWKEIEVDGKPVGNFEKTFNGYWIAVVVKAENSPLGKYCGSSTAYKPQQPSFWGDDPKKIMDEIDRDLDVFLQSIAEVAP